MAYRKDSVHIDRRAFYKEKTSLFKEHSAIYPDKDLFGLYNEWADSNSIYGIDRHEIWKRVRHIRGRKTITIKEGSEEWIRLQTVLDIFLEADLKYLHELIEQKYGRKKIAAL